MTTLIACAATAVLSFIIGTIFGGIMVGAGGEDAYKAGLQVGAEKAYDHSIEGQVRLLHRELAGLSAHAGEGSEGTTQSFAVWTPTGMPPAPTEGGSGT